MTRITSSVYDEPIPLIAYAWARMKGGRVQHLVTEIIKIESHRFGKTACSVLIDERGSKRYDPEVRLCQDCKTAPVLE